MGDAGTGKNRLVGELNINVYGPAQAGLGVVLGHADTLANLFNRATVGAVMFDAPAGPRIISADEAFAQVNVSVPFEVYES